MLRLGWSWAATVNCDDVAWAADVSSQLAPAASASCFTSQLFPLVCLLLWQTAVR